MTEIYNTIIIGAGIAGLNAGRFLKESTLILDKKKEIGLPVQCGEGVSIHALNREQIPLNSEWIRTHIHQIKRIMPNGKYIGQRHEDPYALVLERSGFEKQLASMVKWDICLDTPVSEIKKERNLWKIQTASGDQYYATYLIGADGPASTVAAQVFNVRHNLIPGINYSVRFKSSLPVDELQMYLGREIAPLGYGWLFPISEHRANAGLLIKQKGSVRDYFNRFLDSVIKPLYGECELMENKSGSLPVNGFRPPFTRNRAFLAGDAGAFTDPIFEGGMNMALLTGRLAAESINKEDPGHYEHEIGHLPFTGKDLVNAQKIFFGLADEVLNDLGDVIDGAGTSYLTTGEGLKAFMSKSNLVKNQAAIAQFAKTWGAAKSYLW